MKRIFLFFALAAIVYTAQADQINISNATLNPGGTSVQVTVSLEGTRLYTSYNMDITLPEGWEIELYEDELSVYMATETDDFYPSTGRGNNKTYSHNFSFTYGVVGNRVLRVACTSNSNASFKANSGDLFTIYLQASPYAKPGTPDISITGVAFATYDSGTGHVDGYNFNNAVSNAVTVTTDATAPLYVNPSAQWSTCILPFDAELPNGVSAYRSERVDGNDVYFSKVTSLQAYIPYVLHAATGFSGNVSGTVDPANYPEAGYVTDTAGLLNGAITKQSITTGYVLQKDPEAETPKFYNVNGQTFFIPEGRCWLTLPAETDAPSIRLVIEETSAINMIDAAQDGLIYNILGQPVSQPIPGQVYIQNGKKYIHQ